MGAPCVDAQLTLAPSALGPLLQLPENWRVSGVRVEAGVLHVDVVFPDGPSELPPVRLVPHYRRTYHEQRTVPVLDRIDVVSAVPARPARRRWLMGDGFR